MGSYQFDSTAFQANTLVCLLIPLTNLIRKMRISEESRFKFGVAAGNSGFN